MIHIETSFQSLKTLCRAWFKMPLKLLFLTSAVAIILITDPVAAAEIELLTPMPGAAILARNPETHLVMRESGYEGVSRVRLEKSGIILEPVVAMEGEEHTYLHFRLPLKPGSNNFTIVPNGKSLEISYKPLRALLPVNMKNFYLFHQDGLLPESCVDCHELQVQSPVNQVRIEQQTSCGSCHKNLIEKDKWQHSTTVNQQCHSCHLQYFKDKPWRIGFLEGKIDATCLSCHTGKKAWESRQHLHGAMIGGCTLCHNPHGDENRYYLWAEGSLDICIFCHGDKKNLVDKDKPLRFVHGIIHGKGCTACHDPHASDEEFMVLKPVNELCVSCHPALAGIKQGHPVARHPLESPKKLNGQNRKLTCVGCHDPHGSDNQFMLVETKLGGRLCRECHKK